MLLPIWTNSFYRISTSIMKNWIKTIRPYLVQTITLSQLKLPRGGTVSVGQAFFILCMDFTYLVDNFRSKLSEFWSKKGYFRKLCFWIIANCIFLKYPFFDQNSLSFDLKLSNKYVKFIQSIKKACPTQAAPRRGSFNWDRVIIILNIKANLNWT